MTWLHLVIYGALIVFLVHFVLRMLYSVYYTPGSTVLYNSPVTQQLFPGEKNKLFPNWGYTKRGMYSGQPFKIGQGAFWPESGKGFKPNKFGSPGASPSGGMRPTFTIPAETSVGYWGNQPTVRSKVDLDIYDNSSQHVKYITPVGHWDN